MGQGLDRRAVLAVVLLPQNTAVGHCVPEGADTDLQGAAIGNEGTGVQGRGVVLHGHRRVGHREQGLVVLRIAHQQIHGVDTDLGVVFHVGHIRVHLAYGYTGPVGVGVHLHQLDPGIGIGRQAHGQPLGRIPGGDQLHQHVGAGGEHIAGDMGVVAGDVVALRPGNVLHRAGFEIQFTDLDVRGQGPGAHGLHERQFLVVAEQALLDGTRQAGLDALPQRRGFQAQCGVDVQVYGRVGCGPLVKRVDQLHRLAQSQRRHQHQIGAHAGNRLVNTCINAVEYLSHYSAPESAGSAASGWREINPAMLPP